MSNAQRTPSTLDTNEWISTCVAMESFGGGFAKAIAKAGFCADMSNRIRLLNAFPDLFLQYGPGSDFYRRANSI